MISQRHRILNLDDVLLRQKISGLQTPNVHKPLIFYFVNVVEVTNLDDVVLSKRVNRLA